MRSVSAHTGFFKNTQLERKVSMKVVFQFVEKISAPFLRISLGIILLWIGALKFVNPSPVVMLLHASLSFLAFSSFVYVLGALEIIAAILLFAGLWLRYVGLLCLILFVGILTIFVTAPAVTGFPMLTLAGQFLLKDLVLAAASIAIAAADVSRQSAKLKMAHAA